MAIIADVYIYYLVMNGPKEMVRNGQTFMKIPEKGLFSEPGTTLTLHIIHTPPPLNDTLMQMSPECLLPKPRNISLEMFHAPLQLDFPKRRRNVAIIARMLLVVRAD